MKNTRFTETQIIRILKEADAGTPAKEICHNHGISDANLLKHQSLEINQKASKRVFGHP